ncbi:GGDEF domain-containing protein [Qipengyuania sp. XHP0211]|uniref:GGDEF domain-containing protein n=1 Tax=Qipengyuania sp. XHP0211 TaxID=3038079 RepID=UPI00241FC9F3|nr:GGDEF domain-containing protein [Qipengyuania sp. XHP0211]MDG5749720.1 GGDEF domain-containing protein [Qipengyuania sp. XHP0211]
MALIFMAMFLVLWKRGNMGSYVLGFAAAYFCLGLGFLVTHLVPDPGAFYVFHATQVLYTLGTGALIWAAAKRVGQHVSIRALAVVYAISALTLAAAIFLSNDTGPRLYIINTGYGVMMVIGTMALFNVQRRNAIDTLIAVLFALAAVNFLVRPVLTLIIAGGSDASAYRESIYYSVLSVAVTVASLMTGVALIGACAWDMVIAERERGERDMLTGLRARRAFEQDAIAIIERAKQEGVPVGLVVADIDHFKAVNDVYGHQVGDKAIAAFGGVIADMIRNSDIAGRIGGEEFCILAWNCDDERAEAMAERVRRRFSETAVSGMPSNNRLSASFGVAAREAGEGYGKLFARADAELYRAKESGRNRVCREEMANVVTEFRSKDAQRA